ncbi:MAG: PAS domain S-box protein [Crocinitomicaceae bacterium]|nr:PAS domain S-box protein [Crocinitomicaceae bacterium]
MNLESTFFKQIAENNWDPIVFADLKNEVVYANPAAYTLYEFEPGELIGQNVDVFNAKTSHDTSHIVQSIIDNGGWSGELMQRKKNGEHFYAHLTVSLIFVEDGEPVGYASNSKDISERVKAKELLETALKEKEVLFQEIHHRLKNNLAIISSILELQADKSDDPKFVRAIRDSQRRIKTTALAHEILYETDTIGPVDLNNYVENLSNNVLDSFVEENSRISLKKHIDIENLDIDHAIPLGLIMNELMTNSFKHAFPEKRDGEIQIRIVQEGDMINFKFEDNGIGLPNAFDINSSGSTGMIVVNSLIDQLEGELEINSENGTHYSITFKSN